MTSKQTKALKLALEALESCSAGDYSTGHVIHPSFDVETVNKAIEAIEALAEQPAQQQEPLTGGDERRHIICLCPDCTKPAQEPVASLLVGQDSDGRYVSIAAKAHADTLLLGEYKLYTSPPASKPWVGLTDEEIQKIWRNSEHMTVNQVCRAIEAKLREKNT